MRGRNRTHRRREKRSPDPDPVKTKLAEEMHTRPFEDEWDLIVLNRTPPDEWEQGFKYMYTMKTIGDYWGCMNSIRLKVGDVHHRFMNTPEGFGIFLKGTQPTWGTGGIPTQSVIQKALLTQEQFHFMLQQIGVLLVCNNHYLPGAIGVRVCDKTSKVRSFQKVEIWGHADNKKFAASALKWLKTLSTECKSQVMETLVHVHPQRLECDVPDK